MIYKGKDPWHLVNLVSRSHLSKIRMLWMFCPWVNLYPMFAFMIYLQQLESREGRWSNTTFWEFHLCIWCVYLQFTIIYLFWLHNIAGVPFTWQGTVTVLQVLVEKRKARNPFRRTAPYLLSCDLAETWRPWLCTILRSIFLCIHVYLSKLT